MAPENGFVGSIVDRSKAKLLLLCLIGSHIQIGRPSPELENFLACLFGAPVIPVHDFDKFGGPTLDLMFIACANSTFSYLHPVAGGHGLAPGLHP